MHGTYRQLALAQPFLNPQCRLGSEPVKLHEGDVITLGRLVDDKQTPRGTMVLFFNNLITPVCADGALFLQLKVMTRLPSAFTTRDRTPQE